MAKLFHGAPAIVGEFIAREFLPNRFGGALVPHVRLAQRRKVLDFLGSRCARRSTEPHLTKLLKNRKGSGVSLLRIENLGFREQKDLPRGRRQAPHQCAVEHLERLLALAKYAIDVDKV